MPLLLQKISHTNAINRWNNFVSLQAGVTPLSFNPSLFFFYQNHFGWKPYYLLLYQNSSVIGLLPLVNTGKAWVSLPHFSYGGLITESKELAVNQLKLTRLSIEHITKNKVEPGFYHAEIESVLNNEPRSPQPKVFIRSLGKQADKRFKESEKVTSLFQLTDGIEDTFNMINPNLRRKIRKGDKNNLQIKQGGLELLNDFYTIYSKNIHHLKSLNYSKKFFQDLFTHYNFGTINFFVAYRNKLPVGSAVLASYEGFYENLYFATLPEERRYYIADWLHWQMIKFAVEHQNSNESITKKNAVYSLGRSTRLSLVHHYKKHWPVNDKPLFIYSDLPNIRKNKLIQKAWGFVPYFVAKPLGSKLIKHIY